MKYLFFDTETTSKHPELARLVQLAFIVTDEQGNKLQTYNQIIKPRAFTIPPETSAIHGISHAQAMKEGIMCIDALKAIDEAMQGCDRVVCHNYGYDSQVLYNEISVYAPSLNTIAARRYHCTMIGSMYYCNIPNPYGYSNPKWPRLSELHDKLFGFGFENAHNALADVEATMRCFFELKKLNVI